MANVSVSENSLNSRPTSPPMNRSGVKAATSEMLIESTVKPICRAPSMRGAKRRHALFQIAEHVFDHDDGVVDDEADRDRKRHQGDIVDREARQPHRGAGAGQRQRHRDAGRQRRRGAAQEQKHHQHHQHDGGEQRELHVMDAGADGGGAVGKHRNLDVGRNPALEVRQHVVDAVHRVDHVGVGLLGDDEQHRRLGVEPGRGAAVAHAEFDVGNAAQAHHRAARRFDHEILVLGHGAKLIVAADGVARSGPSKVPSALAVLALAMAVRTSSRLTPIEAIATGLTRMRMAGCSAPLTVTSATPSTWDMRWAMMLSATSYMLLASMVFEVSARIRIGAAAGLTLRMAGKVGRSPADRSAPH